MSEECFLFKWNETKEGKGVAGNIKSLFLRERFFLTASIQWALLRMYEGRLVVKQGSGLLVFQRVTGGLGRGNCGVIPNKLFSNVEIINSFHCVISEICR